MDIDIDALLQRCRAQNMRLDAQCLFFKQRLDSLPRPPMPTAGSSASVQTHVKISVPSRFVSRRPSTWTTPRSSRSKGRGQYGRVSTLISNSSHGATWGAAAPPLPEIPSGMTTEDSSSHPSVGSSSSALGRARPATAKASLTLQSALANEPRLGEATHTPWHDPRHRDWRHNTDFFRDARDFWLFVADRALFDAARSALVRSVAPGLAHAGVGPVRKEADEQAPGLRVWSCGCSSGEELFSARMAYEAWVAPSFEAALGAAPRFCGVGTDRSPQIIDAALDATAEYTATQLANVPHDITEVYFTELPAAPEAEGRQPLRSDGVETAASRLYSLPADSRRRCSFWVEDLMSAKAQPPQCGEGDQFDLILCRYSVFLYCESTEDALRMLTHILARLAPSGVIVLGASDQLPRGASSLLEPLEAGASCGGVQQEAMFNAWRLRGGAAQEAVLQGVAKVSLRCAEPALGDPSGSRADGVRAEREPSAGLLATGGRDLLATSTSLQHLRSLLGLPRRFAPDPPRAQLGPTTGARSLEILREKGGFLETPVCDRVAEFERQRQEKVEAKRAQKLETEDAEIRAAMEALQRRRWRDKQHGWGSGLAAKSFMQRTLDEAEERQARRKMLVNATLASYEHRSYDCSVRSRHKPSRAASRRRHQGGRHEAAAAAAASRGGVVVSG